MSDHDIIRRQVESLEADARLGIEMEQFQRSVPYRYLMAKAELEAMKAAEDLIDCPCTDAPKIMALQGEVKRLRSIGEWVAAAVQRGVAALEQIREREQQSDA